MNRFKVNLKSLLGLLSSEHLYHQIPDENVMDRQRFVLFRIFSFSGALVSIIAFIKMTMNFGEAWYLTYPILFLSLIMIGNFYFVRCIKRLRSAYIILLIAACALLHLMSYSCGGIRTAGTFYFSVIILYAFMLLGKSAGQYFTAAVVLHVIYLYYISMHTKLTSFDMFQNNLTFISQDFLINAVLTFLLVAAMSSYLQSGRNVVIQRLTWQRDELERKNYVLGKKNEELDKFASVASHDLKAPLRAIGTLTDLVLEDGNGMLNESSLNNLTIIKGRVNRMENLINGLLTYSKADRSAPNQTELHSRYLIHEIFNRYKNQENIYFEISEEMPLLCTDKIQLSQVFSILIDNAIKFHMGNQIRINILSEEQETHWLFSVKDNGPGIEKRYHEKIFIIFQTLNCRDEMESTGAGLAIAKKIIEENKGKIWVESAPGQGSNFLFTWKKNKSGFEQMQYQLNEFYQ